MRVQVCSYCNKCLGDIDGGVALVSRMFGILHCDEHFDSASRDVGAYMNKNRVIRMLDTYTHPKLRPLFDILRAGIHVKRSNGQWEPDWRPMDDPFHTPNLIRKQHGQWVCTFQTTLDSMYDITKGVALQTIFDGMPNLGPGYMDCLANAIFAMDKGIYKEDADKQEGLSIVELPTDLAPIQMRHIDGVPVRVQMDIS